MIAYDLKQAGQPPVPTPEMLRMVVDSSDSSMADYPVLKGSPLYIQQSLLFPYTEGTLFFDAVYKKMGKRAFSAVFTDAPCDSAQIIHPERYFAHEKPSTPELPKLASSSRERADGRIGRRVRSRNAACGSIWDRKKRMSWLRTCAEDSSRFSRSGNSTGRCSNTCPNGIPMSKPRTSLLHIGRSCSRSGSTAISRPRSRLPSRVLAITAIS